MQEADSMGIFDPKQQEAAASKELEQYEQALLKVAMAQSQNDLGPKQEQEESKVIDPSKPKKEEPKQEQMTELDEQQKAEE